MSYKIVRMFLNQEPELPQGLLIRKRYRLF